VIYVLFRLTYCNWCTIVYSVWNMHTWHKSGNKLSHQKKVFDITHKPYKIQCRDLCYRVIDRRSQVILQTIKVVGLTVYRNIIVSLLYPYSPLLIEEKHVFSYFDKYTISLIFFLLFSLSCWAHPLQIIMFSGHGEAKAQLKVSSASLKILLYRRSIRVVILCICKVSCCICLQFIWCYV